MGGGNAIKGSGSNKNISSYNGTGAAVQSGWDNDVINLNGANNPSSGADDFFNGLANNVT